MGKIAMQPWDGLKGKGESKHSGIGSGTLAQVIHVTTSFNSLV